MQLYDVAVRIVHEHLFSVRAGDAGQCPVRCATLVEFSLGLGNICYRQCDMRCGGIPSFAFRHRGGLLAAHQMSFPDIADIDPESGYAWYYSGGAGQA